MMIIPQIPIPVKRNLHNQYRFSCKKQAQEKEDSSDSKSNETCKNGEKKKGKVCFAGKWIDESELDDEKDSDLENEDKDEDNEDDEKVKNKDEDDEDDENVKNKDEENEDENVTSSSSKKKNSRPSRTPLVRAI